MPLSPENLSALLGATSVATPASPLAGFGAAFALARANSQYQLQRRTLLSDNDRLDLLQNYRTPAEIADKRGIPTDLLYSVYPEFAPRPAPQQAPSTGPNPPAASQPGQLPYSSPFEARQQLLDALGPSQPQ